MTPTRKPVVPLRELCDDLQDAVEDVRLCRLALRYGITTYAAGRIEDRLRIDVAIIAEISRLLQERTLPGKRKHRRLE